MPARSVGAVTSAVSGVAAASLVALLVFAASPATAAKRPSPQPGERASPTAAGRATPSSASPGGATSESPRSFSTAETAAATSTATSTDTAPSQTEPSSAGTAADSQPDGSEPRPDGTAGSEQASAGAASDSNAAGSERHASSSPRSGSTSTDPDDSASPAQPEPPDSQTGEPTGSDGQVSGATGDRDARPALRSPEVDTPGFAGPATADELAGGSASGQDPVVGAPSGMQTPTFERELEYGASASPSPERSRAITEVGGGVRQTEQEVTYTNQRLRRRALLLAVAAGLIFVLAGVHVRRFLARGMAR